MDTEDNRSRIYLYDTHGNKVDWKEPGDEGYQEWQEALDG